MASKYNHFLIAMCKCSDLSSFHAQSYSEVPDEQKSPYAAWETPEPVFWTRNGYCIVRADERGLGQSPGLLDTMSRGTSECFFDVVEWAASQPWSSGKVGLLGVSYYAGESIVRVFPTSACLLLTQRVYREPVACGSEEAERTGSHYTMGRHVGLLS